MTDETYEVTNRQPYPFYILPNALMNDGWSARIGVYGVAVLNVLQKYANQKTHEAWPSKNTIAQLLSISPRKVVDTIRDLEHYNIITTKFKPGSTNRIRINPFDEWTVPHAPDAPEQEPIEQDSLNKTTITTPVVVVDLDELGIYLNGRTGDLNPKIVAAWAEYKRAGNDMPPTGALITMIEAERLPITAEAKTDQTDQTEYQVDEGWTL